MSALGFEWCKSDASMYYFIDKEIRELAITIVHVNDVYFMGSKDSLLLLELKWKFMMKWKCHNLGETKEFLKMYISYNCKNQKIFIDQSCYKTKVWTDFGKNRDKI